MDAAPTSTSSAPSKMSKKSNLSLDLSNLPPPIAPTPPSNTLLFTNLQSPDNFRPDNLQTIRDLVAQIAPIHAWAPLKSFRRIVVSFFDDDAAILVRSIWDGEAILGERCRVYFGHPTPVDADPNAQHLALPDAKKLFFISPPPSPPHDWEMRTEDAPNKMVHAEDLAEALAKLRHNDAISNAANIYYSPASPTDSSGGSTSERAWLQALQSASASSPAGQQNNHINNKQDPDRSIRSRSSTLVFSPGAHGGSSNLPCVTVDDMTDDPGEMISLSPAGVEGQLRKIPAQTERPPVDVDMIHIV